MGTIQSNSISKSDAAIEQYKSYYKGLNIAQYGTGVLLQTLGSSEGSSNTFTSDTSSTGLESLFTNSASKLSINTDNIKKKIWSDLEEEIQAYTIQNKETKGTFSVAINADTANGQPIFKIASKESVLSFLDEKDKASSEEALKNHPVQVFSSENLPVESLKEVKIPELSSIVDSFMKKNSAVFKFLSSQS